MIGNFDSCDKVTERGNFDSWDKVIERGEKKEGNHNIEEEKEEFVLMLC